MLRNAVTCVVQAMRHAVAVQLDATPILNMARDPKERLELVRHPLAQSATMAAPSKACWLLQVHLLTTDVGLSRQARKAGEGLETMFNKALGRSADEKDLQDEVQSQVSPP